MGKFDGILLCTDLDGTLLTDDCRVSRENSSAIEYFKNEGGKFTFITGRVTHGAKLILEYVKPNLPIVCFNGAGIFDTEKNSLIWGVYLDDGAAKVIEHVERFMQPGIIICPDDDIRCGRNNKWVEQYFSDERITELPTAPVEGERWKKALFVVESDDIEKIRKIIAESEFKDRYEYMRSGAHYYEILPKNTNKGSGLKRLADIFGIDRSKIIAVGDNENDISMFKTAKTGIAVANASETVRAAADMVTVCNNDHAIAKIISDLDSGKLVI